MADYDKKTSRANFVRHHPLLHFTYTIGFSIAAFTVIPDVAISLDWISETPHHRYKYGIPFGIALYLADVFSVMEHRKERRNELEERDVKR